MFRIAYFILAIEAILATSSEVSPIEKVLVMLKDLQTEVVTEGRAEAKTYDKFACFCKDVTEEKSEAISTGQSEQDQLMADISDLTAHREELDDKMKTLEEEIMEIDKEVKAAMEERHKEKLDYDKDALDLVGAISAIENALAAIKASRPASLAEMTSVLRKVKKAALIADAFGIGSPKTKMSLSAVVAGLAQPEVPMQNYEFQSGPVIELLEKLLDDFQDQKADLDAEEVKKVAAHDGLIQEKTSLKKSKDKELSDAKADKESTTETITQKSGDLSTVSATLLDDQEYLKDLHAKCEDKSKTWDSRTEVRTQELTALTQAIQIITDLASKKDGLLQVNAPVKFPNVHVSRINSIDHVQRNEMKSSMDVFDENIGFLQLGKPRKLLAVLSHQASVSEKETSSERSRQQVLSLLRSKAKELRSGLLTRLADKVESDPFKKVRKLIEELIDRLIQEAKDEASHKGWCDEEMGKAKRTRSDKSDEITKLNTKLGSAEALRDKLTEQVDTLEKEIADLEAELEKQTKLREDEKAENEATVKEAEEAADAVKEAIKVLQDFYDKQAKAELLVQINKGPEIPDAGFEGDYKGASDKAGGIIGMLEVIQSDFERTVSETETAEKQASQDFMEFERTTENSMETKKTAKEEKTSELERTEKNISDDMDSLKASQESLNAAITELQELHKACIDTGMTFEERAAAREEELAALKEALCILDRSGPVKSYDNC
jgi:chromosome segregation ATPase